MVVIVNIEENKSKSGPQQYELRIGKNHVATFTHKREDSLHELLLKAAIAAEEKVTPRNGLVKPLLDPLYDEVYFKGMEYLNSL